MMDPITELKHLFAQLCDGLGKDGMNYVPMADIWVVPDPEKSVEGIVRRALGHEASIRICGPASIADVIEKVEAGFAYEGSAGAYPSPGFVRSEEAAQLRAAVCSLLKTAVTPAELVCEIRIDSGHPYYPVFWDYAYVIACSDEAYVLIGSSSD